MKLKKDNNGLSIHLIFLYLPNKDETYSFADLSMAVPITVISASPSPMALQK